jgi:hypothetical protein
MAAAGMLFLLVGCQQPTSAGNSLQIGQVVGGGTVEMADVQPVGGFLPKPELLQRGTDAEPALNYRNPAANLASYHAVMIDPVALWLAPGSPLNAVPVNQRQAAVNLLYSDLHDALQSNCRLERGPSWGPCGSGLHS